MDNAMTMSKSRLIEALDYIDPRFVEETKVFYRDLPDLTSGEPNKKTAWLSLRRFAALAACLLLVGALIPIAHYVAVNLDTFIPSGIEGTTSAGESTETEYVDGDYLNPIKGLEPLPVGMIDEMNVAYSKVISINTDVRITTLECLNTSKYSDRYLGILNGYLILFDSAMPDSYATSAFCAVSIEGYDFYFNEGFDIKVYKEGTFLSLKEAYESGKLTLENIKIIYLRNNEYNRYYSPELKIADKVPINRDDLDLINKAWKKKFGESDRYASSLEEVQLCQSDYCFGYFGSNIVFRVVDWSNSPNIDFGLDVAGYSFTCAMFAFEIYVLHEEEIITLSEAFEQGLLTEYQIGCIAYMNDISSIVIKKLEN